MSIFSLEDMKGKSLVFCVLKKIPAAIGCLLFLCSMLFPFYHSSLYTIARTRALSVYYWSYKFTVQTYWSAPWGRGISEYWLCDYWFARARAPPYFVKESSVPWMLVLMFISQIVALTTGVASILMNRGILSLIPAIMCPMVSVLMICVSAGLFKLNLAVGFYQLGYWLTYPSTALFIINFIIRAKSD